MVKIASDQTPFRSAHHHPRTYVKFRVMQNSNIRRAQSITHRDIENLKRVVDHECELINEGAEQLTRDDDTKDLTGWSPEILMKAAAAREDFSFYASSDFLKWAAMHRRHLAIHNYPEGEDRVGFNYTPHG